MYPHERSLVKRLADQPFALLGVNSDTDREQLKEVLKKEQITWRSFWNGPEGIQGPISTAWNVQGWPTLYLIDAQGVIRNKWVGSPGEKVLDEAVDGLLEKLKTSRLRPAPAMLGGIYFFDHTRVSRIDPDGQDRTGLPRVIGPAG